MKIKPLSVIIPCHNNSRILPWSLRAIRSCSLENIDIICVDDHSIEEIEPIALQYGARYVKMNSQVPGNRSQVRQLGHELAIGTITMYLDGDIVPEPRIFEKSVKIHSQHPQIAIKFAVYSIAETDHRDSLSELAKLVIDNNLKLLGSRVRKHCGIDTRPLPRRLRDRPTGIWMLLASHCMSVERVWVEQIGGWDVSFQGWGEEDLDLAYRLNLLGIKFYYPHRKYGAAYHLDHPVNWDANLISLNRNLKLFLRKYPEIWPARRGLLRMYLRENGMPDVPTMSLADLGELHSNHPQ